MRRRCGYELHFGAVRVRAFVRVFVGWAGGRAGGGQPANLTPHPLFPTGGGGVSGSFRQPGFTHQRPRPPSPPPISPPQVTRSRRCCRSAARRSARRWASRPGRRRGSSIGPCPCPVRVAHVAHATGALLPTGGGGGGGGSTRRFCACRLPAAPAASRQAGRSGRQQQQQEHRRGHPLWVVMSKAAAATPVLLGRAGAHQRC